MVYQARGQYHPAKEAADVDDCADLGTAHCHCDKVSPLYISLDLGDNKPSFPLPQQGDGKAAVDRVE